MKESVQTSPSISQAWYERLDRGLLILVTCELGYLSLLGLGFALLAILLFTTFADVWVFGYLHRLLLLWSLLPLAVALFLNTVGGFTSAVLHIVTKHHGYPGTGHSLNWLFCATNFWLSVLGILIFAFSAIRLGN